MDSDLRVLVIEDDPLDYRILSDSLGALSVSRVELARASRFAEGMARARNERFDAVLLDLNLPDSSGIETVEAARSQLPNLPVVVMTKEAGDATALEALRRGAQDFLVKSQFSSLGEVTLRSLRYAIERHRMALALESERAQREAHKDEFLCHVSHELRTPLSAIQQFASILIAGIAGELSDDQSEYLGIIQRNGRQLGRMINDILDVTRSDEGILRLRRRRMDLAPVAEEVLRTFAAEAQERGIAVALELQDDLPAVLADPARVRQVLFNLVANALEFTPSSGSIRVSAHARRESERVQIDVRDSGCGISPEGQQRIFERMFQEDNGIQRSRKGLGLGLHICRDLVRRHCGDIWVESKPGEGSTFSVTLPSFNLASVLLPKVARHGRLRSHFALVVVRLDPERSSLWEARTLAEVRNILERSIYPDRDVLIPELGETESKGLFFVLASTDAGGARAMTARLRETIENSPEWDGLERLRVDWMPIDDVHQEPPLARDDLKLAQRIEELIAREENIDG